MALGYQRVVASPADHQHCQALQRECLDHRSFLHSLKEDDAGDFQKLCRRAVIQRVQRAHGAP